MGTPYPSYGPPKLVETRGIEGFSPRTHQTLGQRKPQNRAPFLTDLGGESKGKEPRRVHAYIPQQILKKMTSKSLQKPPRNSSENHQKERMGTTNPSLEEPGRIIYTSQRGSYKV
jgi:hypothetical protein